MKTTNELTPELKKAEEEIDNYYKSNSFSNSRLRLLAGLS